MDDKRYEALEQALADLSAGEDMTRVINDNPNLEGEIETSQLLRSLSPETIPARSMHRSRTRILTHAQKLRQESGSILGVFWRKPKYVYAFILAVVFLLSWNGLVYASTQSLPGDQLYPAKLTLEKLRLGLALNPQAHQRVEEEYQARRADEVVRLLALERVEFVEFYGNVEQQWDDYWIIEGIDVHLLPKTIILGDIDPGMRVEVEGATQPEGWVMASEIHLQNFSFIGVVEAISKAIWTISGRDVSITSNSQIDSDIQVGDIVVVEVTSDDFGNLTARNLWLHDSNDSDLEELEIPTPTEGEENGFDVENDQAESEDESDEPEEIRAVPEPEDIEDSEEEAVFEDGDESEDEDDDKLDDTEGSDETDDEENDPEDTEEPNESDDEEEEEDDDEPEDTEEPDEDEEDDDPEDTEDPNG